MKEKTFNGMTYPEAHKTLWTWLSENPQKEKKHWFRKQMKDYYIGCIQFECFACDSATTELFNEVRCSLCPLCENVENSINCLNGLYHKYKYFVEIGNFEEASKIALTITNLPWIEKQ